MSKKYINADALIDRLERMYDTHQLTNTKYKAFVDLLNAEPAADVRENEYSHKVWCPNGSKECQCAECSAFVDWKDKYCHECGRILLSEG